MNRKIKRSFIFILLFSFLCGSLSACGKQEKQTETPLVVGSMPFSQKFNAFFVDTGYDQNVVDMTQVSLMTTDRMGGIVYHAIEGETRNYNGTDYTYKGIADLSVTYDEVTDITTYAATIRDDIYFSDGVKMSADDIIFTYYAYLDPGYTGSTTLSSYDIVGLEDYRTGAGSVANISGIRKTGDYSVEILVNGFSATAVYSIFGISIAPLHYYGSREAYDYENNRFGFEYNNFNLTTGQQTKPLGAGPYKFIKYDNKVVSFEANDKYYKGTPKIKYVQFKEVLTNEIAAAVKAGTVDVGEMDGSKTRFQEVQSYNANGEISGNIITTSKVDNLGYGYIGINASTVNVGGEPASEASRNLRKALATVIAVYRDVAIDTYYGEAASVIQYPISNTSWAAPQITDEGYRTAFSLDVDDNSIYSSGMQEADRYGAALNAAMDYLKAAGYTFDDNSGKIVSIPEGAKASYEILIPADGKGEHPSFSILTDAAAALAGIGMELKVTDLSDSTILWERVDANTHELWCAAWGATIDPDMYQVYHSSGVVGAGGSESNHYHIQDDTLDELLLAARESDDQSYRKSVYKECLDIIADWAVEIPAYQRQNCLIFSTERIAIDTLTPDITTFWGWMNDIEELELRD